MPLAISNILWPFAIDHEALAVAQRAGATGIEIAPTQLMPWTEMTGPKFRSYGDVLAAMGLRVPSMQAIFFGKQNLQLLQSEESFCEFSEHIEFVAGLAAELGAKTIVFGAPKNRVRGAMPLLDAMELAAERLRLIAEKIHGHGVILVIEPVPPAYGGDFLHRASDVATLVRQVDHPAIGLHLDGGALCMLQENVEELVKANSDILGHVHISRPHLAAVEDAQAVDYRLARALSVARYPGWLSIEMSRKENPLGCIEQAVSVVRGVYGDLL